MTESGKQNEREGTQKLATQKEQEATITLRLRKKEIWYDMEPAVRGAEGARLEGPACASTASCHVRMAARMLSQKNKEGASCLPSSVLPALSRAKPKWMPAGKGPWEVLSAGLLPQQ